MQRLYIQTSGQVWVKKNKIAERERVLKDFQVNSSLLQYAGNDALVFHCLPAERDKEITEDVIEGPQSVVFDPGRKQAACPKSYSGST